VRIPIYDKEYIDVDADKHTLHVSPGLVGDRNDRAYHAALDGVTALILAQACEGMDVGSTDYAVSIETALEAIDNRF
jgi:hypothetical protein